MAQAIAPQASAASPRTESTDLSGHGDLAAITIAARIAPFWRDMPRMWFAQFEAIMAPQKQGQEAKFDLVISKLGKEELNTVSDLLVDPTNRNYDDLKDRLISIFQESADSQFNRLVKEMELGEQKPSQLYRRMAEAARNSGVADDTVRKLWMQRLPTAVLTVLLVSEDTKLENLARMADRIMESVKQWVIAEVTTTQPAHGSAELIQEFRNMVLEVKQLRGEVSELRSRAAVKSFSHRRNRSSSRSRSRGASSNPNWLCRYHFKFRDNAKRCLQPCAWAQQQRQQQQTTAPPAQFAWQPPQGN